MYRSRKGHRVRSIVLSSALAGGLFAGGVTLASASTAKSTATKAEAVERHGHDGRGGPRGGGTVTALTSSSITVSTPDGPRTFAVTSATVVDKGHTSATQADLAVGEQVAVMPTSRDSTTAGTIVILVPHLEGKVVSVNATTIVIADAEGFYRTINISASTTFTKNGVAGSASDVSVGSLLGAEGAIAADHTSLDGVTVNVGQPADDSGGTPPLGDPSHTGGPEA